MAAELKMTPKAFRRRFVVQVGERWSLREADNGACLLLDGTAECTVYEKRPQQCRDFPQWSCFERDAAAWQQATQYCPGIQRIPDQETLNAGWVELQTLYQRFKPKASPVRAGKVGELDEKIPPCLQAEGRLEASAMEVDVFLAQHAEALTTKEATSHAAACPALVHQLCTAGETQPLACRNLNPDEFQQALMLLQLIADDLGYPWSRGEWHSLLTDRAAAWRQIAAKLPRIEV